MKINISLCKSFCKQKWATVKMALLSWLTSFLDIDLQKEYGISFNEHEDGKGKIDVEMDKGGYVIHYDGLLIPKSASLQGKMINSLRFALDQESFSIMVYLKGDDRNSYWIHATLNNAGTFKFYSFDKHDRSKVTDSITDVKLSKPERKELSDYLLQLTNGFNRPVIDAWKQKYRSPIKRN